MAKDIDMTRLAACIKSQVNGYADLAPSQEAVEWANWRLQGLAEDIAEGIYGNSTGGPGRAFVRKCGFKVK